MNITVSIARGHIQIPRLGVQAEVEELDLKIEDASAADILSIMEGAVYKEEAVEAQGSTAGSAIEGLLKDLMKDSPFSVPKTGGPKEKSPFKAPSIEDILKEMGASIITQKGPFGPFGPKE